MVSDWWDGLETFFTEGSEILRVDSAEDVVAALTRSDKELRRIGDAARTRALEQHTAEQRAITLESYCNQIAAGAEALAQTA